MTLLFLPIFVFRLGQRLFGKRHGQAKAAYITLPKRVNQWLIRLLGIERRLLRWMPLPFGVSILCVAHKPSAAKEATVSLSIWERVLLLGQARQQHTA